MSLPGSIQRRLFCLRWGVYPSHAQTAQIEGLFSCERRRNFFPFMPKNMHFVQNVCQLQESMVCYTHIKERTTPAGMLFKPRQRRRNLNVGDHPPDCGDLAKEARDIVNLLELRKNHTL